MAGTPTARGCEACRKQKKRCDQAKPACSRCARLKIACVGSGQKRFIFKQERGSSSASSSRSPPERRALTLSRTPSDDASRRGSAFISLLEITDVRYALSCYGELFVDIPTRLGRNPGLDAAVDAMTITYGSVRKGDHSSLDSVASYLGAVQALKSCFNDPNLALAPETLCAMYICMIVQSLLEERGHAHTHHAETMARIMTSAIHKKWQPGFEADVLTVMCMPVLMESLFNPRIVLEPWIWTLIDMYEPIRTPGPRLATPFESLHLRSLAKFAVYMRNPQLHILGIQNFYRQILNDVPQVREGLDRVSQSTSLLSSAQTDLRSRDALSKGLSRIRSGYSLLLNLGLICNHFLRTRSPEHLALQEEAMHMCNEIIRTAQDASMHRPFGASSQPFGLVTALVTSTDLDIQLRATQLLNEYAVDFPASNWVETAASLRDRLSQ